MNTFTTSSNEHVIGLLIVIVHRRPGPGMTHFGELCSPEVPQKPKIERIGA